MSDKTDQARSVDLEIEELRAFTRPTSRVTSSSLEDRLYKIFPVLDHGFVRVVDYMGDDTSIVQAARVSYGKGTKSVRNDEGLIRYLMRHRHSTPFEMCEIKFHIKLPIFVARQWIRHRTANVNEYSARYSMLDREFYIPAPEHLAAQSEVNNQGRGDVLRDEEANEVLEMLKADAVRSYDRYETLLNERQDGRIINDDKQGLARELARMTLPLSAYTQWYWKVDLHNLVHFLSLRMDPHAQYEIRAFADVMYDLVRDWVPLTAKAFEDYRLNSFSLSGPMVAAVRRMVSGEKVTVENCGMSAREWRELQAALGLSD
jgi:thymidylate synthase (FAD)